VVVVTGAENVTRETVNTIAPPRMATAATASTPHVT
jgi:hypothetical protein